jgi:BolA protein
MNTIIKMKEALACLSPTVLDIEDDSHLHVGHSGAGQGGHFTLTIASTALQNLTRVAAHQAIYQALGDLMRTDIHALRIVVLAPTV